MSFVAVQETEKNDLNNILSLRNGNVINHKADDKKWYLQFISSKITPAAKVLFLNLRTTGKSFKVNSIHLQEICNLGEKLLRKAMNELIEIGYLIREKTRKGKSWIWWYQTFVYPEDSKRHKLIKAALEPANLNPPKSGIYNIKQSNSLTENFDTDKISGKNSNGILPDEKLTELKSKLYSWKMSLKTLENYILDHGLDNVFIACKKAESRQKDKNDVTNFPGLVRYFLGKKQKEDIPVLLPKKPEQSPEEAECRKLFVSFFCCSPDEIELNKKILSEIIDRKIQEMFNDKDFPDPTRFLIPALTRLKSENNINLDKDLDLPYYQGIKDKIV